MLQVATNTGATNTALAPSEAVPSGRSRKVGTGTDGTVAGSFGFSRGLGGATCQELRSNATFVSDALVTSCFTSFEVEN